MLIGVGELCCRVQGIVDTNAETRRRFEADSSRGLGLGKRRNNLAGQDLANITDELFLVGHVGRKNGVLVDHRPVRLVHDEVGRAMDCDVGERRLAVHERAVVGPSHAVTIGLDRYVASMMPLLSRDNVVSPSGAV